MCGNVMESVPDMVRTVVGGSGISVTDSTLDKSARLRGVATSSVCCGCCGSSGPLGGITEPESVRGTTTTMVAF